MVIVGRHELGIMLNDLEYILDKEGNIKKFKDERTAIQWLKSKGFSDDDIYWLTIKEA